MTTRNEVIRNIIGYFPDNKLVFKQSNVGVIVILDGKECVSMREGDTWDKMKMKIDKYLCEFNECCICAETGIMACVNCLECANRTCISCHLISTYENNGITICPFCRISTGDENEYGSFNGYFRQVLSGLKSKETRNNVGCKVMNHILSKGM